jgi:hypothetical protein
MQGSVNASRSADRRRGRRAGGPTVGGWRAPRASDLPGSEYARPSTFGLAARGVDVQAHPSVITPDPPGLVDPWRCGAKAPGRGRPSAVPPRGPPRGRLLSNPHRGASPATRSLSFFRGAREPIADVADRCPGSAACARRRSPTACRRMVASMALTDHRWPSAMLASDRGRPTRAARVGSRVAGSSCVVGCRPRTMGPMLLKRRSSSPESSSWGCR